MFTMATFTDTAIPRKRMTTYGKAARKRTSDYGFSSPAPDSEAPEPRESQHSESRSPSNTPPESEKSENSRRGDGTNIPSSAPPLGANVFDVPSSDDELAALMPKPIFKRTPVTKTIVTGTRRVLPVSAGDSERRKKIKLSPARQLSQESTLAKPVTRPVLNAPNQASKQPHKSLGGQSSTMAARPKLSTHHRKPERPRTPPKQSLTLRPITPTTPSGARSDVDEMDVDAPTAYISPKGLQLRKGMSEPLGNTDVGSPVLKFDIGINGVETSPPGEALQSNMLPTLAGISKNARNGPEKLPRQRLIDSLVEQGIRDDESSDDIASSDESDSSLSLPFSSVPKDPMTPARNQNLLSEASAPAAPSASQGSQSVGPKFTYSRQRSMLSEKDILQELAFDVPPNPVQTPITGKSRRGAALSAITPLRAFPEDEDDIEGTPGIRSVHELRQAGANNRFLDEIEDLLDRIGIPATTLPSSMRRSGLLDLASKLKDKDFERKFRANGVEQRLFVHLNQEMDVIAGFVMISILINLLADTSMPHVAAQLHRQGIAGLLIRLIENQTDIISLSKERETNMSKISRASITELQDLVLKLTVWEDLQPLSITPRTAALKCLELMIRQTREAGDAGNIISKELTASLFSVLRSANNDSSWKLPSSQQAIDFSLALSALESHSITAMSANDESVWISEYLAVIADTLEIALSRPVEGFGLLQVLILRLTLNVTNNNPQASDVFARESLMAAMGQAIVTKFKMISRFLTEEEFSITMDHLILVLGVMINFAEWSSLSRSCLHGLAGKSNDPLAGMIQLFLDNRARTSEAESVEESQKNVAFGYLSVLLGYLSLLPGVAERIRARQPRGNIRPLLASIEEFIGHHKTVDDLIETDEDGHNAHTSLTERLENLVTKLSEVKLAGT